MNASDLNLDQVFEFVANLIKEKILFSGLKSKDSAWTVITDYDLAVEYATAQNHSFPAIVWGDLRQEKFGKLWIQGLYLEWEKDWGDKLYEYLNEIQREDAFPDIDADLFYLCCAECLKIEDPFLQSLRNVYLQGGWPCGWTNSNYANGNLVVFDPSSIN